MSQVIKALVNVQRHHQLGLIRLLCTQNKDLVRAAVPDILLQNLKTAHSAHNVLEIVSNHHKIMNSKHSMQALRSLFELQKNDSTGVSMKDILKHPSFIRLCKKLRTQAGVIELNETIEALKVLSFVGVPSDSIITQVLLQLIKHNVNSLSLNHIMFLDFLLRQFKKSPLVDALQIALPLIFQIHLPLKMDRDNLSHLTEYLFYASRVRLSWDSVQLIVNTLIKYRYEFDVKSAKSIIWSITDMPPHEMFRPLLDKAISDFIVHLDEVSFNDMETTLTKLVHKYSTKNDYYYSEVLMDSVANCVIDQDLGFRSAMYIMKKFMRLNHWNRYLVDYVCKKILEDNGLIQEDPLDIYTLTIVVSLTDYRPKDWNLLENLIRQQKLSMSGVRKDILWVRFGSALCMLNIYKLDVLTKCLSEDYLETLFERERIYMSDVEHYLATWHCIKMYKPEFVDLLSSRFTPEYLLGKMKPIEEFPLEGALKNGVGGEEYVVSDVASKLGHQIDHAILYRKGGFPVPIKNFDFKFIEDIEIPPDHQLVCILAINPILYTINNKALKQTVKISLKALENISSNIQAVPINIENWLKMPEFERIPFLMQKINERLQNESSYSESVMM